MERLRTAWQNTERENDENTWDEILVIVAISMFTHNGDENERESREKNSKQITRKESSRVK